MEGVSQHPVDRLIRRLVRIGRQATAREVERIVERMASVPFNPAIVKVKTRDRGLAYQGQTLGARASSLTYHLFERVVLAPQWAYGTTAQQFLADLRAAIMAPQARLGIYERRGGAIAITVTPTTSVVPQEAIWLK